MKTAYIFTLKLAGMAVVILCWRLAAHHTFPFFWSVALVWGAVALVPLLAASGRWLLDRRPTPERAMLLTIPIHYLEMILLGCALILAIRPLPQSHASLLLAVFRCRSGVAPIPPRRAVDNPVALASMDPLRSHL